MCFKALPSHFIVIDNQIKFLFYHSIDFYRVKVSWIKCKPKVGVHYGLAWTPSGSVERQGKQTRLEGSVIKFPSAVEKRPEGDL